MPDVNPSEIETAKTLEKPAQFQSEDIQFFSYIRRHLGLLTTVASLPIISGLVGVLPTPDPKTPGLDFPDGGLKLNVLASFVCLITFAAAILLRGSFKRWVSSDRRFMRYLPPLITFASCLVGIASTAYYLHLFLQKAALPWQVATYLLIFPSLVFGLGTILATAFAQDVSLGIQNLVLARLPDRQEEILGTIKQYADFIDLDNNFKQKDGSGAAVESDQPVTRRERHNSALGAVGQSLLYDSRRQLEHLSRGKVEVRDEAASRVHRLLIKHFHQRFDAVSDQDLDFWLQKKDAPLSEDYFKLNLETLGHGAKVTRIFILNEKDLEERRKEVVGVLRHQFEAGIGWAIALHEELSPMVTKDDGANSDFAVLNKRQAVTYFRDLRHSSRRFSVVFDTPNNRREIDRQIQLYNNLLTQCWMASETFVKDCRLSLNEAKTMEESIAALTEEIDKSTAAKHIKLSIHRALKHLKQRFNEPRNIRDARPILKRIEIARNGLAERTKVIPIDQDLKGRIFPIEVSTPDDIERAVEIMRQLHLASKAFTTYRDKPAGFPPPAVAPRAQPPKLNGPEEAQPPS